AVLLQGCEGGLTFDCDQYQALCMCDGSKFSCDSGKCAQMCTPPDGINPDSCKVLGSGFSCVGGKCVECQTDTDCPMIGSTTRICANNKCQIKCAKDLDCDPFYKCDTSTSVCKFAGCATNLECISKTGNPLAVCT